MPGLFYISLKTHSACSKMPQNKNNDASWHVRMTIMTSETKICQNCKNQFTIEPDDFAFYEKIKVPPPTFCPHCRMIRRFLFRAEHYLNRRPSNLDDKEIFSGVPIQSPYKVYDHDYWWSDKWSALDFGRDYDFSKTFFGQFRDLLEAVPWSAKTTLNMINSDFCDQASYCKNTYLSFDADYLEDCGYLVNSNHSKDCYDLLSSFKNELCYEGVLINNGYRNFFSESCDDCRDVWFSRNCVGCADCIGCVNLKNKRYHIFNEPYTKEEYLQKLKECDLGSFASIKKFTERSRDFWKNFPVKYMHGLRNTGSSGDYLHNTKNAKQCYLVQQAENVKFLQFVPALVNNSYDYTVWGDSASQMYECLTCGQQVDSLKFCFDCWPNSQNLEYCISCRSSHDLFGCVGLRNKEYCIFNKQYSKDEYFALKDKIVAHMKEMPFTDSHGHVYAYGEFFPPEFSALSYNQTLANDFFPLTKEEVLKQGYLWRDPDQKEYQTTITADELPDHIKDAADGILKEIIQCESCKRAYRMIEPELSFYKKIGLPLPRRCFDCRLRRRFAVLNRPEFYERSCGCAGETSQNGAYKNIQTHTHGAMVCTNTFETAYALDRPEIVYCEQCYQGEVAA